MDLGLKIQKTNIGIKMVISEILCVPILRQIGQLPLFRPKFVQKFSLESKFHSVDLESSLPRYHMCQFSGKTDNFEFFHLNLRKFPNDMSNFGSNNIEVVAKNSVEAEMSWVEVSSQFSNTLEIIN